jgi:ADP-ribosylation factor GTPase-activating protein 2/3
MKLGVKKAGNFEEAEAKAKAEAERIEKLGKEAVEQERQEKLAAEAEAAAAAARVSQGKENSTPSSYYQSNANKSRESSEEVERLGMGMGRMSFGAVSSSKPPSSTRSGFGSVGGSYSPQVEGKGLTGDGNIVCKKGYRGQQYF